MNTNMLAAAMTSMPSAMPISTVQVVVAPSRCLPRRPGLLAACSEIGGTIAAAGAAGEQAGKKDRSDGGNQQGVQVDRDPDLAGDEQFPDKREDLADDTGDGQERGSFGRAMQEVRQIFPILAWNDGFRAHQPSSCRLRRPSVTSDRGSSKLNLSEPRSPWYPARPRDRSKDQLRDGVCQGPDVVHRHETPIDPVTHDLGRPEWAVCRNDGAPHGHGLVRTLGKPSKRDDKTNTPACPMADPDPVSHQAGARALPTHRASPRHGAQLLRARHPNLKPRFRSLPDDRSESMDQQVESLLGHEPTKGHDQERITSTSNPSADAPAVGPPRLPSTSTGLGIDMVRRRRDLGITPALAMVWTTMR